MKGKSLNVQLTVMTCDAFLTGHVASFYVSKKGVLGGGGLGVADLPKYLDRKYYNFRYLKFHFSCWTYGYEHLEWIFDAPNVLFLFVSRVVIALIYAKCEYALIYLFISKSLS